MDKLKNLDTIAYWWVKVSCYLALLMPFIFLPWTIYPYIFGKTVYLASVLYAALPWYLYLIARKPEHRPKKSLLLYGLGVYFLAMLLATIFSYDPNRSFWSYPERMTGFWPLLHYLIFFFMAASVFRGWKEWKKLLGFSVGVSVALSLVAFIQKISPEAVLQSTGARTGSFLNNPIFLAAYLLFNLFFTVLLFQKSEKRWVKITWAGLLAIQFIAFLFAETRGAIIGLYIAIVLYLLLYGLLHRKKKTKMIALILLAAIIVCTLGVWFVRNQEWISHVPGLNRFYGFSFTGGTVETRLIAWDIAIKGFLEKPIFGWGPENYFYAFNKYYNPKSLRFSFYETWFDHAHNQILDQLNNTGIVGTLGYLALFVLVIWQIVRLKKKGKIDLPTMAASLAILAAYFFQNLFIFDQPSALIMFYLCLAWWESYGEHDTEKVGKPWPRSTNAVLTFLIVGIVFFVGLWYLFIFRPAFASTWIRNGVIMAKTDIKLASQAFEKGVAINNQYPDMVPLYYAREVASSAFAAEEISNYMASKYERVYDLLNQTLKIHPANIYTYYLMSLVQASWAVADATHFDQAMADIDRALEYSPKRQQLRFVKGKIYLFQRRNEEAINYFKETVELDDRVSESWWNLGIAQYQAGQIQEAVESFDHCIEIGGHPVGMAEVLALIDVYSRARDLERVIWLYERALTYEPKNARLYAALAAGYLEKGDYEKAREYAVMAKQLDPSLSSETDTFLQLIDFQEAGVVATATQE